MDYSAGLYRMSLRAAAPEILLAHPNLEFGDVRVEASAWNEQGREAEYGLVCRYQDAENFYFFLITGDGYFGIGKRAGGVSTLLSGPALKPADTIIQGQGANILRAECAGESLAFFINGVEAGRVADSDFATGDVGLIAGTASPGEIEVYFDKFSVLQP
jgi:hypothetical protein